MSKSKTKNKETTLEEVTEKTEQIEIKEESNLNEKTSEQEAKPKKSAKAEFIRFLKFTLFASSAGLIQLASFTIFSEFIIKDVGKEFGWSYFISLVLSVIWNFTFNRKFTFKSANNIPIAMLLVLAYYAVFTPISIYGGMALKYDLGWNKYLVFFILVIINFVTEFLWSRYVVFRKSIDTNKKKKKKDKNLPADEKSEPEQKEQETKKEEVK